MDEECTCGSSQCFRICVWMRERSSVEFKRFSDHSLGGAISVSPSIGSRTAEVDYFPDLRRRLWNLQEGERVPEGQRYHHRREGRDDWQGWKEWRCVCCVDFTNGVERFELRIGFGGKIVQASEDVDRIESTKVFADWVIFLFGIFNWQQLQTKIT